MKLNVCLSNTNNRNMQQWLVLPTGNYIIDTTIEKICPSRDDRCFVKEYNSDFNISIPDEYEDIYYLNEMVCKINNWYTDKELQEIIECYSTELQEILLYRG